MSKHYIIDGYNVIFGSELATLDLEEAREALISISKAYRPCRLTLVFDGRGEFLNNHRDIDVVFTRNMTADDYIKNIVKNSRTTTNIIVVSDDKGITKYVESCGAKTISCKRFLSGPSRRRRNTHEGFLSEKEIREINTELQNIWLEDEIP